MIEISKAQAAAAEDASDQRDRVPVFTLGDTTYTMPATVTATEALELLEAGQRGYSAEVLWMLQHALGPAGYAALKHPAMAPHVQDVLHVIRDAYLGPVRELGKN